MPERNVKFQYYALVRQKKEKNRWNGQGKLDIDIWMDKLDKRNLLNATIDLGDTKANVDTVNWFEKSDVWVFKFMKLREDNIPVIVKENQESKVIPLEDDEYIGEGLHMLYDNNIGIAMLQINRFSLGLKRLESFLTEVWKEEGERIKLKPIADKLVFDTSIKREYKSIEISFANITPQLEDGKRSLGTIMNLYRKMQGAAGVIKIGFGKSKGDTLNIDEVRDVVDDALMDESVRGLKLHIKDDDDRPVEIVDLFDHICKDIITFNVAEKSVLNYSYVADKMISCYISRREYIKSLITA